MTALQRITAILERARIDGGWIDETVAAAVLAELGLDEEGEPIDIARTERPSDDAPTSPNLGHG